MPMLSITGKTRRDFLFLSFLLLFCAKISFASTNYSDSHYAKPSLSELNQPERNKNETTEAILTQFLGSHKSKNLKNHKFHIHGWRWHTLSLLRDTNRLEKLALKLLQSTSSLSSPSKVDDENDTMSTTSAIDSAASHVIDFNMQGLHSIENDVFFPWLRNRLHDRQSVDVIKNTETNHGKVDDALIYILNDIDKERDYVAKLGKAVVSRLELVGLSMGGILPIGIHVFLIFSHSP